MAGVARHLNISGRLRDREKKIKGPSVPFTPGEDPSPYFRFRLPVSEGEVRANLSAVSLRVIVVEAMAIARNHAVTLRPWGAPLRVSAFIRVARCVAF